MLHGIVTNYDPQRYRAIVVTLSPEPEQSRLKEFRNMGIEVRQMGMSRLRSMLDGKKQLAALIEKLRPSVIHTHGARADVLASSIIQAQGRVLSTVHADLRADYLMGYGFLRGTMLARQHIAALRRSIQAIAVSPTVADALARDNIQANVVLNGIDIEKFKPLPSREDVRKLRADLGWPEDSVIFLHTGALIPRKRPVTVIESFISANLSQTAHLFFAGDGPLRQECEIAAHNRQDIHFLGPRDDIPKLLQASDALVSASVSEGLPMALIEGASTGVRILASNIYAHQLVRDLFPEQVRLFSLNDNSSLADSFQQFSLPTSETFKGITQPNPNGLRQVSAKTMSSLYQDHYDRLLTLYRHV